MRFLLKHMNNYGYEAKTTILIGRFGSLNMVVSHHHRFSHHKLVERYASVEVLVELFYHGLELTVP